VSATDPHQVFHRTIEAVGRIEAARVIAGVTRGLSISIAFTFCSPCAPRRTFSEAPPRCSVSLVIATHPIRRGPETLLLTSALKVRIALDLAARLSLPGLLHRSVRITPPNRARINARYGPALPSSPRLRGEADAAHHSAAISHARASGACAGGCSARRTSRSGVRGRRVASSSPAARGSSVSGAEAFGLARSSRCSTAFWAVAAGG
jgi:hypothetical protein